MATLDSSPSLFPEQTWALWAKRVEGDHKKETETDGRDNDADVDSGTMKLRKEDMSLYGLCPSRDEFYLVVCDRCGQVIKPQALKKHVELRHKEKKVSPSVSSKGGRGESKRSLTKTVSMSNLTRGGSSATGRTVKPSKSEALLCSKASKSEALLCSKPSKSEAVLCSKRAAGPATELAAVLALAPGGSTNSCRSNHHHASSHHRSSRKNHSLPFVKVERMPSPRATSVATCTTTTTTTTTSSGSREAAAPKSSVSTSAAPSDSRCKHTSSSSSSRHSKVATKPLTPWRVKIEPRIDTKQPSSTPGGITVPVKVESCCASTTTTTKESVTTASSCVSPATTTCLTTTVAVTTLPSNSCRRPLPPSLPLKDRKFLPCKDREFDADKHCGVWIPELARPCTRSLTCKTHALSLRRAVQARSKSFDDLLREHRAIKEALLKAKAAAVTPTGTIPTVTNSTGDRLHKLTSSPLSQPKMKRVLKPAPHKLLSGSSPRSAVVSHVPRDEPVQLPAETYSRLSSDGEDDVDEACGGEKPDYPYVNYHPRPAAVNGFGSWLQGSGCYIFNRKQDLVRSAFMAAVNRHLHPPPHKRLCVESKLPQGSNVPASTNDPYEFTFPDHHHHHPRLGGNARVNNSGATNQVTGHKAVSNKDKVRGSSSVSLVSSPGGAMSSLRTPVTLVVANRTNVDADVAPSGSWTNHDSKRKHSAGVVLSQAPSVVCASSAPSVNQLNLSAVSANHMTNPISIAIPVGSLNVNLGPAPIGGLGMSSVSNKHPQFARNNLFKDLNIVVTNIDGSGLVNGHLVTIPGIQLPSESVPVTTHNHVQTMNSASVRTSAKAMQSGRAVSGRTLTIKQPQQVLMPDGSANSLNAIVNAMSVGGAVVMDTAPPPGTVVAPSSLQMAFSYVNTGLAPNTTPIIRPTLASPQVSTTSPLLNGIIPSSQTVTMKAFPSTPSVAAGATGQVAVAVLEQQQLPQLSRIGHHCKASGKNGERRRLQQLKTAALMAKKNSVHAQLSVGLTNPTALIAASNLQQVYAAAPVMVPGRTIATPTNKLPMQPVSFTIMAPPGVSGLMSQPGGTTLVLESDARRTSVDFQNKLAADSPNIIS